MRKPTVNGALLQRVVVDLLRQLSGRLQRQPTLPVERRPQTRGSGCCAGSSRWIQPLRAALRDVVHVGRNRKLVALDRVRVAADALIDVRRHVDHVAGGRHQRQQRVGGTLAALRRIGTLDEMDVHVHRARVFRVARHDVLGQLDHFRGAGVRRAVALPVAPRPQVHHRLDVERRRVEIVREPLVHLFQSPPNRPSSRGRRSSALPE
jgi:hypothetical protein